MAEVAVSLGIREPTSRRLTPATEPTPRRARTATTAAAASTDPPSTRTRPVPRRKTVSRAPRATLATLLSAMVLLWPGAPRNTSDPDAPSNSRTDAATGPGDEIDFAVAADVAAMGAFALPEMAVAKKAAADEAERKRAEEERQRAAHLAQLKYEASQAILVGAWRDAAPLVDDLSEMAPEDEDVARWGVTVRDQLGVRDLVEAYRVAQESRDADAYANLWVGLPEESLQAMRRSYAQVHSLALKITGLYVHVGGTTATVAFRERITFDLRNVGQQTTEAQTVLTLQKTADGWRIAARETSE
jgi:hypothetical protein